MTGERGSGSGTGTVLIDSTHTAANGQGAGGALAALAPRLEHAPARAPAATSRVPRWVRALLGVPLLAKLAGAAGLVALVMTAVFVALHATGASGQQMLAMLFVGLLTMLIVNLALVYIALRPVADLEALAYRVLAGDLEARARASVLADRDIARLGRSLNLLLDSLVSDRARMRRLAAAVIRTHDQDRARVARELHDSVAQGLAAQAMQLGAAARSASDPVLRARLLDIRGMTISTMEELRALSQSVYPQMLAELGLAPALAQLARQAHERCGVLVDANTATHAGGLPPESAAVLYRVAEEAIENACLHAAATRIRVAVTADDGTATLTVVDNGSGFDAATAEAGAPSVGIFSMRERVALAEGRFEITSTPGQGTRVVATVPMSTPRSS